MNYLPEAQTDFIMAVISEELGILGVLIVLGLYFSFMLLGVRTAVRTPDLFGKLLAVGITFQLMFQAVLNLGAMSGLLPVTGVPLPFISYGGSSLMMNLFLCGVLVNISGFIPKHQFNGKAAFAGRHKETFRQVSFVILELCFINTLQSGGPFFTGADVDCITDFIDKDFPVTRFSCFQNLFSGLSHLINRNLADHNFDLQTLIYIAFDLDSAIKLRVRFWRPQPWTLENVRDVTPIFPSSCFSFSKFAGRVTISTLNI